MKTSVSTRRWRAPARLWLPIALAASLAACGGGGGGAPTAAPSIATFIDSPVQGLAYTSASRSGRTDRNGNFPYTPGEKVTFSIGNLVLGSVTPSGNKVTPLQLVPGATAATDDRVTRILRVLQSLDEDGNLGNGIQISDWAHLAASVQTTRLRLDDDRTTDDEVKQRLPDGDYKVTEEEARQHFEEHEDDDSNADQGYDGSQSGSAGTVTQPASTSGRLLASNCFQCHGTLGLGGFDKIRGGEASEVFEYLREPASGDIMAAHAQGYTTAQLQAIVNYLQQK